MILREMIDTVFSRNSLVALWETDEESDYESNKEWEGMAHEIPERFLNREATVFGAYGYEDGHINIHLEDKYTKPTVDKLLTYAREVSYLYNDCHKKREHVLNRFFSGVLEGVQYITNTVFGWPFKIDYNENGYITSIRIGSKTVEMRNTDD